MQNNSFAVYFGGGALAFNIVVEGALHPYKAPEPHVPHQFHFSASTSDLTQTISFTTAPGSGIYISGGRLV